MSRYVHAHSAPCTDNNTKHTPVVRRDYTVEAFHLKNNKDRFLTYSIIPNHSMVKLSENCIVHIVYAHWLFSVYFLAINVSVFLQYKTR